MVSIDRPQYDALDNLISSATSISYSTVRIFSFRHATRLQQPKVWKSREAKHGSGKKWLFQGCVLLHTQSR